MLFWHMHLLIPTFLWNLTVFKRAKICKNIQSFTPNKNIFTNKHYNFHLSKKLQKSCKNDLFLLFKRFYANTYLKRLNSEILQKTVLWYGVYDQHSNQHSIFLFECWFTLCRLNFRKYFHLNDKISNFW